MRLALLLLAIAAASADTLAQTPALPVTSPPHVVRLVDLATILGPIFSLGVGLLTLAVLRGQSRRTELLTLQLKRADILQTFNSRYDQLWAVRQQPDLVADPATYYGRFWSLQLDQYVQWRAGFVQDEDFETWLNQRCRDFRRNADFKKMPFGDGWDAAKSDLAAPPPFLSLVEALRHPSAEPATLAHLALAQARNA